MHTWQWQRWQGLPYLRCSLLEPWPHGFFTQQCWPHPPTELVQALEPIAVVYQVKQVHGNGVLHTHETEMEVLQEADALVSDRPQESVWVSTADCTPVLIGDDRMGKVSAIHAGWRGTAAKIVPTAIQHLQNRGSQLADLRIAMGPAIAGDVYQVGVDVAAKVGQTVVSHVHTTEDILSRLWNLPNPPLQADPEPDRVRLDVRRINALQLEQLGIAPEQMAIAPHCTYQQPEYFFSYRRTNQKKVQWSGIVSR